MAFQYGYGAHQPLNMDADVDDASSSEMSALDTIITKAVAGALIKAIKATKHDGSWKEQVLAGFEEAWDELEDDEIWHRLIIQVAFNSSNLDEEDIDEVLNSDMKELADSRKDDIIDAVLSADVSTDSDVEQSIAGGDHGDDTDDNSELESESDLDM